MLVFVELKNMDPIYIELSVTNCYQLLLLLPLLPISFELVIMAINVDMTAFTNVFAINTISTFHATAQQLNESVTW